MNLRFFPSYTKLPLEPFVYVPKIKIWVFLFVRRSHSIVAVLRCLCSLTHLSKEVFVDCVTYLMGIPPHRLHSLHHMHYFKKKHLSKWLWWLCCFGFPFIQVLSILDSDTSSRCSDLLVTLLFPLFAIDLRYVWRFYR